MGQPSPEENLLVEPLTRPTSASERKTRTPVWAHLLVAGHGHCQVASSGLDRNRTAFNLTTPDICRASLITRTVTEHDEVADTWVPRWKYAARTGHPIKGKRTLPP
jgi:hypothetical protein